MTWNEADHPRDEIGRFTNKDGSTGLKAGISMSEEERQALFGDSIKNELRQKEKSEHINTLLNILGKYATHADILYPQIKKLEEKIKNLGLGEKLGKLKRNYPETTSADFKTDFQKNTSKHEILRQASVYCYDNGGKIPEGFKRVGHFEVRKSGFDSVVIKNESTKEIIIAYRGMELLTKDMSSVGRLRAFDYTSQMKDAQAVYEKIKNDPDFKDYEIYATGTSLGGYLAQYVAAKNNLKCATFNAYHGTKKALVKEAKESGKQMKIYPDSIVNYRNSQDTLTNSSKQNNFGLSLDTKGKIKKIKPELYHAAENMGDLTKTKTTNKDYNDIINHLEK